MSLPGCPGTHGVDTGLASNSERVPCLGSSTCSPRTPDSSPGLVSRAQRASQAGLELNDHPAASASCVAGLPTGEGGGAAPRLPCLRTGAFAPLRPGARPGSSQRAAGCCSCREPVRADKESQVYVPGRQAGGGTGRRAGRRCLCSFCARSVRMARVF